MSEMLDRWFYISTSRLAPNDTEKSIRNIVEVSIARNQRLGVTGALLFIGQRFTQYLEGPATALAELQHSILADSRHEAIHTIASGPADHRRFLGWSLAYAGPSRFVAGKVEEALSDALTGGAERVEPLAELLTSFVVDGHG